MGTHTKIIEFYGLPGCGKTTLCNKLKVYYEEKGYIIGILPDAANDCSWKSLFHSLSLRECISFFSFFIILITQHVHINLVLSPIRRILIFKHAKRIGKYDYLFIDHGIVQSVVRALHEVYNPSSILKHSFIKQILLSNSVDGFIECKIEPSKSFERIRVRNRRNSGTFDQFPDEQLNTVLENHSIIFKETSRIINNKIKYEIDSSCDVENCLQQIVSILKI